MNSPEAISAPSAVAAQRRAVITGMGVCTPFAMSLPDFEDRVMSAKSSIHSIRRFDSGMLTSSLACSFDSDKALERVPHSAWMDRGARFTLHALDDAIAHAGIKVRELARHRLAIVVGSSHSGIESSEQIFQKLEQGLFNSGDQRLICASSVDHPATVVCGRLRALGPKLTFSSACASGNTAAGVALDLIRSNQADVVIVVGTDTISPSLIAGFNSLRALAPAPAAPFSDPPGITLGEGAGVLVVEEIRHAQGRNARALAEILGYGLSGDAHHETAPDSEGHGVSAAIERALHAAGVHPSAVDYVSAHGTGTAANDAAEARGTHRVLGASVPMSSSKSIMGHTLGASGVLELIVTLSCAGKGVLPHTANFRGLRVGCPEGDYVPNSPRTGAVDVIVNNNFGFGGNNSSLIVSRSTLPGATVTAEVRRRCFITGTGSVIGGTGSLPAALPWLSCGSADPAAPMPTPRMGKLDLPPSLKGFGRAAPMMKFGLVAAREALGQAGMELAMLQEPVGLICGVVNGAERSIEKYMTSVFRDGMEYASASQFPMTTMNALGGQLSIAFGLKGYNTTLVGSHSALYYGASLVRRGRQGAVLVASADELTDHLETIYRTMGLHAVDGQQAAEGAGALMLESAEHAAARGATPLAEILATATLQDGKIHKVSSRGTALQLAIASVLKDADVAAGSIDAIVCAKAPLKSHGQALGCALGHHFGDEVPRFDLSEASGLVHPSAASLLAVIAATETLHRLPSGNPPRSGKRRLVLVATLAVTGDSFAALLACPEPRA